MACERVKLPGGGHVDHLQHARPDAAEVFEQLWPVEHEALRLATRQGQDVRSPALR